MGAPHGTALRGCVAEGAFLRLGLRGRYLGGAAQDGFRGRLADGCDIRAGTASA